MTKTRIDGIRAALIRGKQGVGRPYAEAARREVVALLQQKRREGVGVARVASELGLSATTLRTWEQRTASPTKPTSPFREVAILAESPVPSPVVVHGPSGLRIEGLAVAALAELVRRLG